MEIVFIFTLLICTSLSSLITKSSYLDPIGIFIAHTLLLMLPPAILHLVGFQLEGLYSDYMDESRAIIKLSTITIVSFSGIVISYIIVHGYPLGRSLLPSFDYQISDGALFFGILFLTFISIVIIIPPLAQTGFNVFATADLIRHEWYFSGKAALRQFQFFANFFSGAYLIYLLKLISEKKYKYGVLVHIVGFLFVFNLFQSMIMGGKTMIVFPLAFTIITYEVCVAQRGVYRLVLSGLLIAAFTVALQFMRTEMVQNVNKPASEHIYMGLYFALYDSSLVYIDTDEIFHHTELGQDFITGAQTVVPRALWENKPNTNITVGSRFKDQITNSAGQGGWPVYGSAQWYVNFGWFGVFFGGLLTGWILSLINTQYKDYRENPFSLMIMLNLIFIIMGPWPGGIHSFFPVHYVLYVVPLFIFKFLTQKKLYNVSAAAP